MAQKPKSTLTKRLIIIAIPIIIIEGAILLFFDKGKPVSVQQALNAAVDKMSGVDDRRRAMARVQLAVDNFMQKTNGRPPKDLNMLRPEYFDTVPMDPATNKPFAYKVENGRPYIGYDVVQEGGKKRSPFLKRGAPGVTDGAPTLVEESLESQLERASFTYDPTGKRDPYRPFDFAPKTSEVEGKSPLERYEYGQLKLTAVLAGMDEPHVIIENSAGRGFTAKKGMKIGIAGGEIAEIFNDKLVIVETSIDFTGEKKTKMIEMRLRTKDQEKKRTAN